MRRIKHDNCELNAISCTPEVWCTTCHTDEVWSMAPYNVNMSDDHN